ncbi:glycerophosphodiester phosphodiesterase [Cohnella yongneupensis]|uniref:Glycerophosphodiester phosphodiesterase n=1 Tax=Cohnella yongneupensis TaxID=425006 RepID=A0ABW0R4P8_9BACL
MNKIEQKRFRLYGLLTFTFGLLLSAPTMPQVSGKQPIPVSLMSPGGIAFTTIGHRGASGYAPESTLAAYWLGVGMNVDYLELDLQMTKDGEIVVMHDPTVNRTTNGKGAIRRMTLAEIKALDAGSWFNEKYPMFAREEFKYEKVPTLREVFEQIGDRTMYMLETKSPDDNPGLEEKMWALVQEFKLTDRIAVQSFSKKSLRKIREWNSDVKLFQLLWYNHPSTISREKINDIKRYANGIGPNFGKIDEAYVRKVKKAGLLIYPYTVNFHGNMEKAMRWGVDGIHTDYPERFREVVERYGKPFGTSS